MAPILTWEIKQRGQVDGVAPVLGGEKDEAVLQVLQIFVGNFRNEKNWTLVNFGAQEIGKEFLGFKDLEKMIQGEFEVQMTLYFFLKSPRLF
jgi:hypothetical protein